MAGKLKNGKLAEVKFNISVVADPSLQALLANILRGKNLKNKTVKNDLFVRIKSISSKSEVKFLFSKPLMQLANFSIIEEREAIKLSIASSFTASSNTPKILSWKITEFGLFSMNIKLKID